LPLFSPLAIAGYITGFGGSGLIYQHLFGARAYLHVPLAGVTGGLLGVGVAFATLRLVSRFESGRGARDSEAYGQEAEITVAIPVDGFGEVAYVAGGIRQAIPARGDGGAFVAGQRVRIVRIVGGTAQVRALPALDEGSVDSTNKRFS
jgi:membrane protein implicated in regulation of membrane protease activity